MLSIHPPGQEILQNNQAAAALLHPLRLQIRYRYRRRTCYSKSVMKTRFDTLFRISIILKGLDALLEIIGGTFLLFVTPHDIVRLAQWLSKSELTENPHDFIGTALTHGLHSLSTSSTLYGGIYLLSHGIIKMFVIINVLRNKYWAYPLLIVVLLGFIIYQIIDIVQKHSIAMTLLSIFDAFIVVMTWLEWQKQRALRQEEAESDST